MKKLLTLFSVFVLGLGSSFELASCTSQVKHIIDDDDEENPNQDIDCNPV
ncbi:hypothetical protein [Spiroplasma endosymbiont of Polydrusus cervinus]